MNVQIHLVKIQGCPMPTNDDTSETTVWNVYYIFPYIYDSLQLQKLVSLFREFQIVLCHPLWLKPESNAKIYKISVANFYYVHYVHKYLLFLCQEIISTKS